LVRLWPTDSGRALRAPIEAERRSMEKTITANLTEIERNHLLSTLTKIHRSASDLLSEPIDHGESPAG
jgi:DNA-binding MarR family transcriptional regulator